ncbi:uncharacterized protein LTR77_009924 [Saxophila tyrrhenica]|uniref:lipoyl(octanoyl) transferase n=1 Tax=Saxophila tyrrhenica TaxID=1690608 RepID=A0AAV9NWZ5_9PEZI|nr:hypothetical protein LTR77_009924 [Saxophila tyrrhenica]
MGWMPVQRVPADVSCHLGPLVLVREHVKIDNDLISSICTGDQTMRLRHLPLPDPSSYKHAGNLQSHVVTAFLAHKASPATVPAPKPTIITFEPHPIYTCGRREVGHVSKEQIEYLEKPIKGLGRGAKFAEALRGGQTTFHGPGQLVAYPILDLKRHGLTARCYVNLLEEAVIATCANSGVKTQRTENPGVWTDELHKICALGVHMRRNISSHGIGLNVATDLRWFDKIVACGLEGKKTTTLQAQGVEEVGVQQAGHVFVQEMVRLLGGIEGVDIIAKEDIGHGDVEKDGVASPSS